MKGFIDPFRFVQGLVIGVAVTFIVCLLFDEAFIFNTLVLMKMFVGGIIGATIRMLFLPQV